MYYYIKNLQGDIVKVINQAGVVYASYVYDAYGNILESLGEPIIYKFNPFRYRGYVYDRETGLYYLQSRYYDPVTGRFLNADDTAYIGATGTVLSTNLFSYCENNHIIYADYSGNQREKMSYSWDIRKVSSSYKVYVIYYAYGKNNFKTQAYNCYNYDAKSKNTTIKGVSTKDDFIRAWNNMPKGVDYVFILLHGGKGELYFHPKNRNDNGTLSNLNSLNSKAIKCKLWIFSCKGAAGGGSSIAAKFAKKTIGTLVYALTSSLSYSWSATGYAARPSRGSDGAWKWFRYYYNRGKLLYNDGYLYR